MNLEDHFKDTDARLRGILTLLGDALTEAERDEVYAHLDADEFGLALETLCGIIVEENKTISQSVYDRIEEVGRSMKMDSAGWERIKKNTRPG